MKSELKQIETIERYLLGSLNSEEKALVEAKMLESPTFKESVERQAMVVDRLQSMGLRAAIQEGQDRYEGEGKGSWKKFGKWGLGMILLLAVIGLVWWGMPNPEQVESGQLVETDSHTSEGHSDVRESIPEEWKVPFAEFEVDAAKGGKIQSPQSRSTVQIPANALIDENGQNVKGKVTLRYREFRDAVDIAFSEIPMDYEQDGESYQFNSAGMFEIRAIQDGKPVYLKEGKSLKINFELTERMEGLSFYALADSNRRWAKLRDIPLPGPEKRARNESHSEEFVELSDNSRTDTANIAIVREPIGFGMEELDSVGVPNPPGDGFPGRFEVSDERTNGTLLAASDSDPTHHYTKIVRGLQSSTFGVYNCDQIFRLPAQVQIQAKYLNPAGVEFRSFFHLSMINLQYNSAFSFSPNSFTVSTEGETALLLFLKGGAIYGIHPDDYAEMNITKSGSYTFEPENLFQKVETTKELKQWLGMENPM